MEFDNLSFLLQMFYNLCTLPWVSCVWRTNGAKSSIPIDPFTSEIGAVLSTILGFLSSNEIANCCF